MVPASSNAAAPYHPVQPVVAPTPAEVVALALVLVTTVVVVPLQLTAPGLMSAAATIAYLWLATPRLRRNLITIVLLVVTAGFIPINTDINNTHFVVMSTGLIGLVVITYLVSRYFWRDGTIRFRLHHGRWWTRREWGYLAFIAALSYLLIPVYLVSSGSFHNWVVLPDTESLIRLAIGLIMFGIWDEYFFVATIFRLMRQLYPLWWANAAQAVVFTAFLWTLGFRGWGFIPVYIFAFLQGYVFEKSESLFYVVTVHLTLDTFLFFALIWSYFPEKLPIFIAG